MSFDSELWWIDPCSARRGDKTHEWTEEIAFCQFRDRFVILFPSRVHSVNIGAP